VSKERERPITDELMQAYLDGELEEADAERLVEALHGDREKAKELRELEALVETAARLPVPPLPENFVARTLERVRAVEAPPPRPSWRERIFGRRILELRLSLAGLSAVAAGLCLLVAAAGTVGFLRGEEASRRFAAEAEPVGAGPAVVPAAYHGNARGAPVRFVFRAETASRVEVAGDFNGWVPEPLVRRPDGFFELVVPLAPGRYEYSFCVDGRWGPDPAARRYVDDGFGGRNSVIEL
jgi:anti-sigma factor RsiW